MVGALPLTTMAICCHRLTAVSNKAGIRSLSGFGRSQRTPASKQYLYPPLYLTTLFLKTYRGKPAISGFGKLFTPTHKSSQRLAIRYGSDLHPPSGGLHPAHG